ncbi:MAG TPA: hypothetical protein VNT76_05605, partial [Candidatus Binatus sp.]|nr:hypothetical protein [Candidatus Binatus sp.]
RLRIAARHAPEPRLFPKQQAARLATSVGRAIAPQAFEMNGIRHMAVCVCFDCVTGLVGDFVYPDPLPAKGKHFGHKGETVQAPLLVQCRQDFGLAADLHPFPGAKPEAPISRPIFV